MRLKRAGGLAALIVCASLIQPFDHVETQTIGSGGVSYALQIDSESDYYAFVATLEHMQSELNNRLMSGERLTTLEFQSAGSTLGGQRTYFGRAVLESGAPMSTEIRFVYVFTAQTPTPQCPPDRIKTFVRSVPRSSAAPLIATRPTFEYVMQILQSPPAELMDLLAQYELVGVSATVNNNPPTGFVATVEFSSGSFGLPVTLTVECMSGQPGLGACGSWNLEVQ